MNEFILVNEMEVLRKLFECADFFSLGLTSNLKTFSECSLPPLSHEPNSCHTIRFLGCQFSFMKGV